MSLILFRDSFQFSRSTNYLLKLKIKKYTSGRASSGLIKLFELQSYPM